jgi:hypothetical protein
LRDSDSFSLPTALKGFFEIRKTNVSFILKSLFKGVHGYWSSKYILVEGSNLYVYQVDLQLAPGKGLEKWGELISNKKSSIY